LAAIALPPASLPAQVPVRLVRPTVVPAPLDPARTPAPVPAVTPDAVPLAGTPAAAPAPADPRQQMLQTLQKTPFDRRTSAILAAWSQPELEPYDPEKEKESEKPSDADKATGEPTKSASPAPAEGSAQTPPGSPDPAQPSADATVPAPAQPPADGSAPAAAGPSTADAEKAKAAAAELAIAQKKVQREFQILQRNVTLGRWDAVGAFLRTFPDKDRQPAYEHLLRALVAPPQANPQEAQRMPPQLLEKNVFDFADVFALAGLLPGVFGNKHVALLAPILQRALERGLVLESLLNDLRAEVARPAGERRFDERQAALLLAAIGQDIEMGPFLPTVEAATAANDREGFNLMARLHLALYAKEKKPADLEDAWRATQATLAAGEVGDAEKAEALRRAVELAPKIREDLGPAWLEQSFTQRPERGMEILATIGSLSAKGFQERAQDTGFRERSLGLQKTAVEALLRSAPQLAEKWRPTLDLLAGNWIVEASWSQANSQADSMGPVLQRDEYGNLFYSNVRRGGGGGMVAAIDPGDLLEVQPQGPWLDLLDDGLKPHLATVAAQLYLKVNEDERAFPCIERLAASNPRKASELATEFLRVWMRNHNPNVASNRTNPYMFMYGFEQRAAAIPLTRSKQERNLAELAGWVKRLRALPIDRLDEKLLGEAFMTAHSTAEVYRLETIEKVFGPLGDLDPRLLAEMLQKMRTNLATVWRRPSVQEQSKTKRSQKDIEREVVAGYKTATTVVERALAQHRGHWALLVAKAALMHDANNFQAELKNDSGFAETRQQAFALFQEAAAAYAKEVPGLRVDEETTQAFDSWFYGALGACDLGAVNEDTVLAQSQLPLIRAAIDALPEDARKRHESMFANALFTRMSAVKPQVKYRYLDAGFAIAGDHPQAREARRVFDYYKDLTAEIVLDAAVDGPAEVGTEPFGVRVALRHTVEIERESGGFGKYLQNQNNMSYAYNYGRPTENYRDKFQEAVTQALNEHFEVVSVTFNADTATSISTDRPGWRITPYAYLLLKARGPQVDRLPALKIDLDFLDTSGYAILPVGSAPVPIDASKTAPGPRPFSNLEVTQILDERHADAGKLVLEVKATAKGLVPALDQVIDADFAGFRVAKTDDQDVSVTKFAEDQSGVVSERVWLLTLVADEKAAAPTKFTYAPPRDPATKMVNQRYADADLETVGNEVELLAAYGHGSRSWLYALAAVVLAGGLWLFARRGRGAGETAPAHGLHLPSHVTPFTVLALLREIGQRCRLDPTAAAQLQAAIASVENDYFTRGAAGSIDLRALAEQWLGRAG